MLGLIAMIAFLDQFINWTAMARSGVKEIPILDKEGCIIGDISAIDLMRFYHITYGK